MSQQRLLGSRIAGGNTAYNRVESDYYPTPPEVTEALLHELELPSGTRIWEPACGEGHMANVFKAHGLAVTATDIQDQGYGVGGTDFLTTEPVECDWIITNPPFSLAEQFIRRCAEMNKPFALLLKSQYWHARSRMPLFRECQPTLVLPLTWRPDFLFKKRGGGSPLMDCIWCVWDGSATKTAFRPIAKPSVKEARP